MTADDRYLRNCWYQAAWSHELEGAPLARTLLEVPVVFFRNDDGVAALLDRCPHRFAPLSAGTLSDGVLKCGYHGVAFSGAGHCVHNPHGPIVEALKVQSFPSVERHHAIWIWMGDVTLADPGLIPDLSFIDDTPEVARLQFYMPTAANYQLLTDNIMDLSHADYLHSSSLGGAVTGVKARVFERSGGLVAEWTKPGCTAPPMFQGKVPSPGKCDYWIEVEWQAPAVMTLATAVVPAGQPRQWEDFIYALHSMTPETGTTSHYFACGTRRVQTDNVQFSSHLRSALEIAFVNEDKPMLEKQQARMAQSNLPPAKPALLPIDEPAVRIRRRLDALIKAETAR
jgi:vanillate O-demethylase monooxygenase subunit